MRTDVADILDLLQREGVGAVVRELMSRSGIRYIFVGGTTYLIELVVILLADHFGANQYVSVALSFFIGLMVGFTLQKLVTFGDKRVHAKLLTTQIAAFSALVAFNFGFTLFMVYLFRNTEVPLVFIRTLAILITTIWNYYLYRTRIFRQPDGNTSILID